MLPRSLNTYSKQIIFKFDIQQSTSTCFLDNCWKIHYRRTMRKLVWEMLLLWTPTNLSKNHGRPKLYAIASFLLKNINERKTIIELGGKSQNERGKPSCFTYMISLKRITIYIAQVAPFPLFSTLNTRNKTLWVVFLETNIKPLLRKKILNHFFWRVTEWWNILTNTCVAYYLLLAAAVLMLTLTGTVFPTGLLTVPIPFFQPSFLAPLADNVCHPLNKPRRAARDFLVW